MARIFITGSADGLGQLAAKALILEGHEVVLHARNAEREKYARDYIPGAHQVLTADLSNINEIKDLASKVNSLGKFNAIIHNAGVYQVSSDLLFTVNTLAPYILTSLIEKPERLIYLSSGMHLQGSPKMDKSVFNYSDTKLHDLILSMIVANSWPDVYSNAVDPGWVPTKMGGKGAPDNLEKGYETQAWLAVSNDRQALVTGRYFHHKQEDHYLPSANDPKVQEDYLALCERLTGLRFSKNK